MPRPELCRRTSGAWPEPSTGTTRLRLGLLPPHEPDEWRRMSSGRLPVRLRERGGAAGLISMGGAGFVEGEGSATMSADEEGSAATSAEEETVWMRYGESITRGARADEEARAELLLLRLEWLRAELPFCDTPEFWRLARSIASRRRQSSRLDGSITAWARSSCAWLTARPASHPPPVTL